MAAIDASLRVQHIDEALVATRLELTGDERGRLEAPYRPHRDGEFT